MPKQRTPVRRRSDLRKPELPDLPIVSNSSAGAFRRCRWMWERRYLERYKPHQEAPPLRFGKLIHEALAAYYKVGVRRGPHPATTFLSAYEREAEELGAMGFRVHEDEKWMEAGPLGEAMLTHYVDVYGKDPRWKVLATETRFEVLVNKPDGFCSICGQAVWPHLTCDPQCPGPTASEPWFIFRGVLDLLALDLETNLKWIWDHKTASAINTRYLLLDDQAGSYWSFGVDWLVSQGLVKKNEKLAGMLFNFLRKAPPDSRPQNDQGQFLNKDGTVSKVQPAPHFLRQPTWRDVHDRQEVRTRVLQEYAEMEAVRKQTMAAYKNPGATTCNGCWAFDACELHETGHDWRELLNATCTKDDPFSYQVIEDRK